MVFVIIIAHATRYKEKKRDMKLKYKTVCIACQVSIMANINCKYSKESGNIYPFNSSNLHISSPLKSIKG